jgi:hypothetical protein
VRLFGLLALTCVAPSALAFEVAGLFPLNYTVQTYVGDASRSVSQPKLRIGYGALIHTEGELGFEAAVLLLPQSTQYSSAGVDFERSNTWLSFPLGARLNFSPYLSLGAGAALAIGYGNEVTLKNNSAGSSIAQTYADAGLKRMDVSLYGSVRARLPLGSLTAILLDTRYQFGLTDLDDSAADSVTSVSLGGFMLIAGLGLRF